MLIYFIGIFAAVSLFCFFKTNRAFLLLIIVAILWASAAGPVIKKIIDPLQSYPYPENLPWKTTNLIIVLGSGVTLWEDGHATTPSIGLARITTALRLHRECLQDSQRKCLILLSGGGVQYPQSPEAKIMQKDLISLGVQPSHLLLDDKSNNTFQSASYSSRYLKENSYEFVTLVTSGFHMKRSLHYFSHFGLHPHAAPADFISLKSSLVPSTTQMVYSEIALHEWIGLARYYLYEALGWNR